MEQDQLISKSTALKAYTAFYRKHHVTMAACCTDRGKIRCLNPSPSSSWAWVFLDKAWVFLDNPPYPKNPPSFALPGSKILRPPPPKSPADPTKNEVLVWNRLIHCPKGILSDKCLELACGSLLSLTWTRLLETKPSINMYKQLSARGFGFWCNNTFWYLKV